MTHILQKAFFKHALERVRRPAGNNPCRPSKLYPDRELELRIYGGANASFLWYEDEGDSYRYEDGVCSKVLMQWKDSERTLTIGLREGSYPGMPEQVKMRVKLYLPDGAALESKECVYTGREIKIKF